MLWVPVQLPPTEWSTRITVPANKRGSAVVRSGPGASPAWTRQTVWSLFPGGGGQDTAGVSDYSLLV